MTDSQRAHRAIHVLAVLGLAALIAGVTVHRSHWISEHLERERAPAGTTALARDYVLSVWIPTRALRANLDPYDPEKTAVRERYHETVPSGPYTPSALLFLLPVSALSLPDAAEAMNALNILLIWLSLLVLIPPRSPRACGLVAVLGLATFNGWAGESALLYGQPIGFFTLGAALVSRAILRDRFGPGAIVGLVLLMTKAQFALPIVIVLAVLRKWRALGVSFAVTVAASLPFGVLFVRAAGGVGDALAVIRRSASWTDATFSQNRTDLLSLLTGNDAASLGTAGRFLQLVVLSALVGLIAHRSRLEGPVRAAAIAVALVAVDLVAVYHQWYDLTVLVVPAAVLLSSEALRPAWRDLPLVSGFTGLFLVVNLATRGSVRHRLEQSSPGGRDIVQTLDQYWPPLISLTLLAATLAALLGWSLTALRSPLARARAPETSA